MRLSPVLLVFLTACWPYLSQPYEDYVDSGDVDTTDPDTDDPDTDDPDTDDPDTDDPDTDVSCQDDSREDDDTFDTGTTVSDGTRLSGTICPTDVDVFRLTVPDTCEATITLGFTHSEGDLDLHVYDGNTEVVRSDSTTNDEQVSFTGDGSTYAILVNGYEQSTNDYLLVVGLDCEDDVDTEPDTDPDTDPDTTPGACVDDVWEDNDTRLSATQINTATATRTGRICGDDHDFFRLNNTPGCQVTASVDFTHSNTSDIELRLYDASGNTLGSSQSSTDDESVTATAAATGAVVELWGYEYIGQGAPDASYVLSITEVCTEVCEDDAYEEDDTAATAVGFNTTNGIVFTGVLCPDDPDYRSVDIPAGCTVDIAATGADFAPDMRVTADSGTITGTAAGNTTSASVTAGDEPVMLRFAAPSASDTGSYTVDVDADCASVCIDDELEDNDTQTLGTPVAQAASYSFSGSACPSDDDWFRVATEPGCDITVDVLFTHSATSDIDLRVVEAGNTQTSNSSSDNEQLVFTTTTSQFDVRVYGYSGDFGDYDLIITQECDAVADCPEDAHEPNDSEDAATDLDTLGLQAQGALCTAEDSDDTDYYAFTAPADCTLSASFDNIAYSGTELSFYGPSGNLLSQEGGTGVLTAGTTQAGIHYISVYGGPNSEDTYDLTVDVVCESVCEDDDFEANDTQGTAAALDLPIYLEASACLEDEDWYQFPFFNGCKLGIDLAYPPDVTAPITTLFNGSDTRGSHTQGLSGESIVYSPRSSGTVELQVMGGVGIDYTLAVANYDCEAFPCDTDLNEPNDNFATASQLLPGEVADGSLCEADTDVWWLTADDCPTVFDLQSPGRVDITAQDIAGNTVFSGTNADALRFVADNLYVFIEGGDGSPYRVASEQRCETTPTCPTDDLFGSLDSLDEAAILDWGIDTTLALCGDSDFFTLPPLPTGCAGRVFVNGGNAVLWFVNDDGSPHSEDINDGPSTSDYTSRPDEQLYLRVFADNGAWQGGYSLETRLECP